MKNKILKNIVVITNVLLISLICSIINLPYILSLIIISLGIHTPLIIKKAKHRKKHEKPIVKNEEIKKYQKEITLVPVCKQNIKKAITKRRVRKKY